MVASCCAILFESDLSSSLGSQVGCNRIKVNSNCMDMIDLMINGGNSLNPAVVIYEECTLLCHDFIEIVFRYYPRKANTTAHGTNGASH